MDMAGATGVRTGLFEFMAAPVGVASFVVIGLTAICFPLIGLLGRSLRPISLAIILLCAFLFAPAITCSIYSVAAERAKVFGLAALLLAGVTVVAEPETVYFLEMGIATVPITLLGLGATIWYQHRMRRWAVREPSGS
jgi:hypothetical protein